MSFFCTACAGIPPIKEYTLARTSLVAAKKFQAKKYNPDSYRKAVFFYKKGKKSFENRYYSLAKDHFKTCLELAEEAEDIARWTQYKNGDFSL